MSNADVVSMGHHRLPVLTYDNFADWEIGIISFLTGAADHVRVIEQRPNAKGELVDPVRPTSPPEEVAKWDSSEREAMSVIMTTASRIHRDVILKHRADRGAVFKLWTKICDAHQSRDASLRYQAWIEFLSSKKTSDETYSAYIARKEGLGAKIERITPVSQSRAEHFAELILFATLFGLQDNIRQALETQADLTLQQARDVMVRVDTGAKVHLANEESANAAGASNCWKCDAPGHIASACPHASAIKDIVTKRNISYREKLNKKRSKTQDPRPLIPPPQHARRVTGPCAPFGSTTGPALGIWNNLTTWGACLVKNTVYRVRGSSIGL